MFEIERVAFPGLLKVTICGALEVWTRCAAKVSEDGDNDAAGVEPVPLRVTCCVLPLTESSENTINPVLVPVPVGVNVTLRVQFAPADRVELQLPLWAKSPAI
jgi:hypothetical protein